MLKAPVAYQGSKARELKTIDEHAPQEFKTFVDVFGGGGSVSMFYLHEKPQARIIYNDIDGKMCELFRALKDEAKTAALITELKDAPTNLDTFKAEQKKLRDTNDLKAFLYCSRVGFRGDCFSAIMNGKVVDGVLKLENRSTQVYKKLDAYPPILNTERFAISNEDALAVLAKHAEDPTAFIYMDPPYLGAKTFNGNYVCADATLLDKLHAVMYAPTTKAKIMIHLDFTGHTFTLFKDHIKTTYPSRYLMKGTKGKANIYQKYQLIATNY